VSLCHRIVAMVNSLFLKHVTSGSVDIVSYGQLEVASV